MKNGHKYGAKPTVVDGVRFDSMREAARYQELRLMLRAGAITNLVLQPRYPIEIKGHKVCTYVADFAFRDAGCEIVEDVKGFMTPVAKLKLKMVKAVYGIDVRIVR